MNPLGGKKRTVIVSIGIAVVLILCVVLFAFSYIRDLEEDITAETRQFLTEVSLQGAASLRNQVNGDLRTLESIANYIANDEDSTTDNVIRHLNSELEVNPQFKRMGLILPDGRGYTTDGFEQDFSDRDYFSIALQGTPNVSDTFADAFGEENINVYAVPIRRGDAVSGVLFATVSNDVFRELLAVPSFGGEGFSYVIEADGTLVVGTHHPNSLVYSEDQSVTFENEGDPKRIAQDIAGGKNGFAVYTASGGKKYMSYSPLGIGDWYVLSVTPASVATQRTDSLIASTVNIWVAVVLTFVILLVVINLLQRKRMQEYEYLAYVDALTGLSNQKRFEQQALRVLERADGAKYALIAFDVDKFRLVKDAFGTERSNEMLKTIASALRRSAKPGELYARTADDNFVMLAAYRTPEDLTARIHAFVADVQRHTPQYNPVFSFGVYEADDPRVPVSLMYDRALFARRKGKGAYENSIYFYNDEMRADLLRRKQLEDSMHDAVKKREFLLYYQPQYSLRTETIVAAEALVRWEHPELGFLTPNEFIPLFEQNGFIVELDLYMLEGVCATLRRWTDEGLRVFPVAVNLSRAHLSDPRLPEKLQKTVAAHGVSPGLVVLEWTENILAGYTPDIARMLERLRGIGFRIAMDDFGTGYSSLGLLKNIPVDILKLDRSFFTDIIDMQRSRTIVESVVAMARKLGVTTVAEGIEIRRQVDFLRDIGCDIVQGYYFARPMPEAEYKRLLLK